jgi:hypothetical protein
MVDASSLFDAARKLENGECVSSAIKMFEGKRLEYRESVDYRHIQSKEEEMDVVLDADIKAVAEFMQGNIPASKLVGVAKHLPALAKLLWGDCPQETCTPMSLFVSKPKCNRSPSSAIE